jgi:Fic family protein
MRFETFKAGRWQPRYQYKSFEPVLVNHEWIWEDPRINALLEQATRALGELNAFSLIVPDIDLFIAMHVVKEAQSSSKIEGTQTGIDEALMPEAQIRPEKRDDWREVRNYIDAVNTAINELQTLPLSNRLLKQTHAILMQGVRGEHKLPGEFRVSQNWIGGSSLSDATFIPPHQNGVAELMSDLEKFWHNEDIVVPHLIRVAISHYQFETIHPFLDGNGRIGRLLIPLYLVGHGLLAKPSLYLSDFFERNRASYYDALMRVRMANDLIHWVRFFLNGVAQTASKGRDVFRQILSLRTEMDQIAMGLGKRTASARHAIHLLYGQPVIEASDLERGLSITTPTANALIKALIEKNILVETTGQQRGRVYAFQRYLDLFTS